MLAAGYIDHDTRYWHEGINGWQPIDQIEESLEQLVNEADPCHGAFLCKVLGMYSGQLESKHQGLGEKIAEACQEVYVTVREHEMA